MKSEVVSTILFSEFGIFKKPDTNLSYLTYDIIPKSALLGILGAIIGLKGYKNSDSKTLEFYETLKDLRIGIQPLLLKQNSIPPYTSSDFIPMEDSFSKAFIQYINYHGYGSYEEGGNLIIREQIIIQPAYRIYINVGSCKKEIYDKLIMNLKKRLSYFTPYMGKNEFHVSYLFEKKVKADMKTNLKNIRISTLFFYDVIEGEGLLELGEDIGRRYNLYLNYPYALKDQQYLYKTIICSNGRFDINQNKLNSQNSIILKIGEEYIFLF